MRPNHQNKRMRGRNRNGKGPNPLSRTYESNGPDVKVRGTAQHIAEKYMQLGRDASATGDHIAAENYFQHAEHYFRILNAMNQAAMQHQQQYQQRRYPQQDGQEGPDGGEGGEQPEYRGEAQTITPDLNESGAEVVAPARPAPAPEPA